MGPRRRPLHPIAWGRDLAARRGVRLLGDSAAVIGGVRFLGSTLWTDLRLDTLSAIDGVRSASRWMNDYRRIWRKASGPHKYVRPADLLALHRASRSWLDDALGQPRAGPTVVVTHHAPHRFSLPDGLDLAHCYASDLSRLIRDRQPSLWYYRGSAPPGSSATREGTSTAFDDAFTIAV